MRCKRVCRSGNEDSLRGLKGVRGSFEQGLEPQGSLSRRLTALELRPGGGGHLTTARELPASASTPWERSSGQGGTRRGVIQSASSFSKQAFLASAYPPSSPNAPSLHPASSSCRTVSSKDAPLRSIRRSSMPDSSSSACQIRSRWTNLQ